MTALANFGEKLKGQSDQTGNVLNLSKHKFSKTTYSFLNKNHNFVPTQANYSIKSFNQNIENVFQRIKLTAHFGTNNSYKLH